MHRSTIRALAGAGVALALGLLTSMPAAGDTHLGGHGSFGVHYLADSREYPGARCRYGAATQTFAGAVVRAPFVFARDRTAARDHQRVGWRVTIQRQVGSSGAWELVASSPWQDARGWDDQPARLDAIRLGYAGRGDRTYRVIVKMHWLRPGTNETEGVQRHRVDWLRLPADPAHPGTCPGGVF